ncbi:MAG: hypothetical protein GX752_00955 [Clostridium sp.]|nr:hypothetical protein [Clostridium sp.]
MKNNIDERIFKEGIKEENLDKLKKVDKGDLHNHGLLGMKYDNFNDWARGNVKKAPEKLNGIKGLISYVENEVATHIKKKEDLEDLIELTIKDAINDGVKILETNIDYDDLMLFTNKNELFSKFTKIKEKYTDKIDFRPEIGIIKDISEKDLNTFVVPVIESGVFTGIDLYGDESVNNYDRFRDYFNHAKKYDLKLKAHAGEFSNHKNVKKVIEILNVDEIQHGIGAYNDDYTLDLIKERNIRLNMCPISNYKLGAFKDMKKYPIKKIFDKGITITVNTDDLLLFDSSASEQYLFLYKLGIFTIDELNEIRKNSLIV